MVNAKLPTSLKHVISTVRNPKSEYLLGDIFDYHPADVGSAYWTYLINVNRKLAVVILMLLKAFTYPDVI